MLGNVSQVTVEHFADDGRFPNSVLPVVLYRAAITSGSEGAESLEALLDSNGWPSQWRADAVFDFDHYHSTAHECLGIARGSATLQLGGPDGRAVSVSAGDVVVLPAGVAHRQIAASPDFQLVGGYPKGQRWDVLRGQPGDRPAADRRIAAVPLPRTDPVSGPAGPLLVEWR